MMTMKKKTLVAAIAATGLCMAAGSALAGGAPPTPVSDLCGMTLDTNTVVDCYTTPPETFSADCKIYLDPGVELRIDECEVDADGYALEIYGDDDATLQFDGNGSISSASKINFGLNGHSGSCESAVPVINVNGYDFESNGRGKRQSRITMNVRCGSIDIEFKQDGQALDADRMIWLKTVDGDIDIRGDAYDFYYAGESAFVNSGEDGAIKVFAGGEGRATVGRRVTLSAGEISINSQGGSSEVQGGTFDDESP